MSVSEEQVSHLLQFLEDNRHLAHDRYLGRYQKKWLDIASELNALGPIKKTVNEWQEYWRELRENVKWKAMQLHVEMRKNSMEGKQSNEQYTEPEERTMNVVGSESVRGFEGVQLPLGPSTSQQGQTCPSTSTDVSLSEVSGTADDILGALGQDGNQSSEITGEKAESSVSIAEESQPSTSGVSLKRSRDDSGKGKMTKRRGVPVTLASQLVQQNLEIKDLMQRQTVALESIAQSLQTMSAYFQLKLQAEFPGYEH